MTNRPATNLPNIPKTVRLVFSTGIIFLLMLSLLRLALFLAFSRQGHSFSAVLPSFLMGIRFDCRYIGILELVILILGFFPKLDAFRRPAGRSLVLGVLTLGGFLVIFFYTVDFAHYSYLAQRLSASDLNYLTDAGISAAMVWQTYPVFRLIIVLVGGTWLIRRLMKWVYRRVGRQESATYPMKVRFAWLAASFLVLGLGVFGRIGQYPLRWSDAFTLGSDYQANLALNPFQSFFSSMKFRHSVFDAEKVRAAIPVLASFYPLDTSGKVETAGGLPDGLMARRVVPRPGTLTSRPNVVVVICESFSAYKSSMWGNPLNTTPFFNGLCQKGVFFDHCFTPSYGTARGVWAVITGIPDVAAATTTSSRNPLAVDQHTIINNFTDYKKFYFLGGSTSWANIRGLLTDNIHDLHLYEQQNYSSPKVDVWGISDKNLFLEANKVLRQQDGGPFLAIIQTADNHRPYTIPSEDRSVFHPLTMPVDSLHKYGFESNDEMNAFRYTDFGYQTFIEAASKEKYFDNTVFLFVGDHGIPGDAGGVLPKAWTDQRLTAEHVPLLLYAPKLLTPQRISSDCSQVDVLPTLAGLCNITYDNTTLGRDLLDTARMAGRELSFIYDPDQAYIGLVRGNYFYRKGLKTDMEVMVSVVNNDPVPDSVRKGPIRKQMAEVCQAMYEVSRYLLLKNKKRGGL